MINTESIEEIVRQQIKETVESDVLSLLDNEVWINQIEDNITQYAQHRVLAKFNNSESMPQIIDAVKHSVEEMFTGDIHNIGALIDPNIIKRTINDQLSRQVKKHTEEMFLDSEWIERINAQIINVLTNKLLSDMSNIGVENIVKNTIGELFKEYVKTIQFNGIDDKAEQTELTVFDDAVVVENELISNNISVLSEMKTKDLVVLGTINIDAPGWQTLASNIQDDVYNKFIHSSKDVLLNDVINIAKEKSIDFGSVTINGNALVDNNVLSDTITESSLTKIGKLQDLKVNGETELNDTVFVKNKRLGINTDTPSMALSVWDEEIEIACGKIKPQTAYIGTNRVQKLQLGVNRSNNIEVDESGLVTIQKLQVGKNRISHSNELPGYQGSKGDIVFNSAVSNANPVFGWVCVGGYNWLELKSG